MGYSARSNRNQFRKMATQEQIALELIAVEAKTTIEMLCRTIVDFDSVERELQEAELLMSKTRLELAALVFPDFNENFAAAEPGNTPMYMFIR